MINITRVIQFVSTHRHMTTSFEKEQSIAKVTLELGNI